MYIPFVKHADPKLNLNRGGLIAEVLLAFRNAFLVLIATCHRHLI